MFNCCDPLTAARYMKTPPAPSYPILVYLTPSAELLQDAEWMSPLNTLPPLSLQCSPSPFHLAFTPLPSLLLCSPTNPPPHPLHSLAPLVLLLCAAEPPALCLTARSNKSTGSGPACCCQRDSRAPPPRSPSSALIPPSPSDTL